MGHDIAFVRTYITLREGYDYSAMGYEYIGRIPGGGKYLPCALDLRGEVTRRGGAGWPWSKLMGAF